MTNMMMKHEGIAALISPFDDGLVVYYGIVGDQGNSVLWQGFKETKLVPCRIAKHHQQKNCSLSQYNFEDLSNLNYIGTEHFGYHKKASLVCCTPDNNLVIELIAKLHCWTVFHNITWRCR